VFHGYGRHRGILPSSRCRPYQLAAGPGHVRASLPAAACRARSIATARAGAAPTRVAFRPWRGKGTTRADEGTRARPRDRSERAVGRRGNPQGVSRVSEEHKQKGRGRPYSAAYSVTVTRCYRRRLPFGHGRVCASVQALTAQRLRPYRLIRIGSRQSRAINTEKWVQILRVFVCDRGTGNR
jgi:hypothetical protein